MKLLTRLIGAALIFSAGQLYAESNWIGPKDWWHIYEGTVGEQPSLLTIHVSEGGKILGHHSALDEAGNETRTEFSGLMQEGSFTGTEIAPSIAPDTTSTVVQNIAMQQAKSAPEAGTEAATNASPSARLTGLFYIDSKGFDRFAGHRHVAGEDLPTAMNLMLTQGGWGTAERRYADFHGTDADVEAYTAQVKTAILQGEKQWLAKQLIYPFENISVQGRKLSLQSEADFLANFETIFHTEFKAKLKTMRTSTLHSSNGGISLGRGEVWIFSTQMFPSREISPARFFVKEINT